MSEDQRQERPRSIDAIGESLGTAMREDAPVRMRRRKRRLILVASTSLVVVAFSAALSIERGRSDPFTVDQAIAAVTQAAFEMPREHPDDYLHLKSRDTNVVHGGTRIRNHKFDWVARSSVEREDWLRPGHISWRRVRVAKTVPVSRKDRAIEAASQRELAREYRRMKRRHSKRIMDFKSFSYGPFGGSASGEPIVCRFKSESPQAYGEYRGSDYWKLLTGNERLPETSEELYALLNSRAAADPSHHKTRADEVWETIDFTTRVVAGASTAQGRSLFIGALALVPGVETYGETKDPTGRETIGFSRTSHGWRSRIYFDRATGLNAFSDRQPISGKPLPGSTLWRLESFDYVATPPKLKETPSDGQLLALALCPHDAKAYKRKGRR